MRILPTAILALAFCCAGIASATEVYRWTDEKGVKHYSDTPPSNKKYERVNVRTGQASQSEPEATGETTTDAAAPPARTQAQVDPAVRAQRCQTAQSNLVALRSNLDVNIEENGETRLLSTEERATQIAQNERVVAANCQAQ